MNGLLRTRVGGLALLLVASAVGLTAPPADATPVLDSKRIARSVVVPAGLRAQAAGRDVTLAWRAASASCGPKVDRYEVRYRQAGQSRWSSPVGTTLRTLRVEDLVGGRRASFEVRARSGSRASAWSSSVTAMPVSRPGTVRLLTAVTPHRAVRLSWIPGRSGGARIERYEIMYRTTGSGPWKHVHRSGERATISDLRNATRYSFRVRAENAIGAGPWTTVLRARPGTATPTRSSTPVPSPVMQPVVVDDSRRTDREAPTDTAEAIAEPVEPTPVPQAAEAKQVESTPPPQAAGLVAHLSASPRVRAVALSWVEPSAGGRVHGYQVRVRVSGSTAEWSAPSAVTSTSALIGDLEDGAEYEFAVRAVGPSSGAWSTSVSAAPGTPTAPGAPTIRFTGRALSTETSWSDAGVEQNGGAVNGWQVRYRAVGDSGWDVAELNDPTTRALQLAAMTGGFTYRYAVRARNGAGPGEWSPERSLYVPVLTLPVLSVDTAAGAPVSSRDDYVSAAYSLDPNGARDASGAVYGASSGTTDIKGRGNSTWDAPKKPYRLKLGSRTDLLGMPANKNWVLLANYYDHSLLRNDTALYLGTKTRLAWTPRTRYVEVLLNGDYLGLYQLAEQVRIDPGRIDIKSMKSTDTSGSGLTGGYQLERDGRWDPAQEAGFTSSLRLPIVIKDPEAPTPEQSAYIEGYVNRFEAALTSAAAGDPATGYAAYIDVDSFVDWYLVEEYVQNVDANFASTNLFKPRGVKLTMGPLWDFDLSLGNDSRLAGRTAQWYVKNDGWWAEFFHDPTWADRVETRWRGLRAALPDVEQHVRSTQTLIATAAVGDGVRWGTTGDHDLQIDIVHDFLIDRASWLDTQWGSG